MSIETTPDQLTIEDLEYKRRPRIQHKFCGRCYPMAGEENYAYRSHCGVEYVGVKPKSWDAPTPADAEDCIVCFSFKWCPVCGSKCR